ncbi:MAG TPA: hypothetical protein VFQ73_10910 [Flavisolibacter sp.]|nr:hypothetical protein [Flavisolibacter sp.]
MAKNRESFIRYNGKTKQIIQVRYPSESLLHRITKNAKGPISIERKKVLLTIHVPG